MQLIVTRKVTDLVANYSVFNWRLLSLRELTPIIFYMELTHFGSELPFQTNANVWRQKLKKLKRNKNKNVGFMNDC